MSYVYFIVINNVLCYHLSAIATGSDISSIAYRIQSLWFRKFPKHCEHRPFRILWNESRKQSDAKKENAGSCVRASDWKRHAVCESVCVSVCVGAKSVYNALQAFTWKVKTLSVVTVVHTGHTSAGRRSEQWSHRHHFWNIITIGCVCECEPLCACLSVLYLYNCTLLIPVRVCPISY